MALDRVLTQDEIDSVFKNLGGSRADEWQKRPQPFDFRRPDRIAKDQLRSIHLLHETFARSLASSLSGYLRAYAIVNLVSVEQPSFLEFSRGLPSPTCLVSLGMKPMDGSAVLELNPSLVFPILEMLLGGNAKHVVQPKREITEIERSILEGLFRIVLNDLRNAWQPVTVIRFSQEGFETEPQLLQILAPNEAVVAIAIEVRVGEHVGMMNLGIPSIIVKMLRHRFDQQWSSRKTITEEETSNLLRLLKPVPFQVDARLAGPQIRVSDFLELKDGDVLSFNVGAHQPLDLIVNGVLKFRGSVTAQSHRRAFAIQEIYSPAG
jgi:flagellar motor switch protein FliM